MTIIPFSTTLPGVVTTTVENKNAQQSLPIVVYGSLNAAALEAEESTYLDVYLDVVEPKTRINLLGPGMNTTRPIETQLPPAKTYIFESNQFSGVISGDFGSIPQIDQDVEFTSGEQNSRPLQYDARHGYAANTLSETDVGPVMDFGSTPTTPVVHDTFTSLFVSTLAAGGEIQIEESPSGSGDWESCEHTVIGEEFAELANGVMMGSFVRTKRYARVTVFIGDAVSDLRVSVVVTQRP